jgi:hypothetical protein
MKKQHGTSLLRYSILVTSFLNTLYKNAKIVLQRVKLIQNNVRDILVRLKGIVSRDFSVLFLFH